MLCHLCGKVGSVRFRDQANQRPRENLSQAEYRDRGVKDHSGAFSLPLCEDIYQIPAMACPPVWWIVVDGTPTSRSYWNTLGTSLRNVCEDMPPHVHVGLLVATDASLAIWDLKSAVPHVRHLPWNAGKGGRLPLTPATSNLQAALRALGDTAASRSSGKIPLGATLEIILDTMQQASHPGNVGKNKTPTYAGGRILCLLGGAPAEVKPRRKNNPRSHEVGTGGHGGSCARVGQRYTTEPQAVSHSNGDPELGSATHNQPLPDTDDTDMTASNLIKAYDHSLTELYYSDLGEECARAGMGVDILVLTDDNVGLPFLRQLSDRSGAPGPLLCLDSVRFEREVASRTPWHRPTAFGGMLRIRLSPGFAVDATEVEGTEEEGPQFATLYSSGGLMGPAKEQEESLWIMGTCDVTTTVTIDMKVDRNVTEQVHVDGLGEVMIKHTIQSCFAYSTIEKQEDGSFMTVRRLQVASVHMPLAFDAESLYATLDPEALAVVLFHALTIASLQDGVVDTHEIGQQWLQSIMVCAYRSAELEEMLQKEQLSRGLDNMNPFFYAQERLLNRNGELSAEDVLLGQGHERLHPVPLVLFSLLQCDALRPSMGTFCPSMDARCAASAQMYSMSPSILARCIAPRLELWASGDEAQEPIMENMDLNLEYVALSLMDQQDQSSDLILFLDSPREIVVCDSRFLQESGSTSEVVIGKTLERSIQAACRSYRVPPTVVYELDLAKSSPVPPSLRIADALVEDSRTVQGLLNFAQWKEEVAAMIQE